MRVKIKIRDEKLQSLVQVSVVYRVHIYYAKKIMT